MEIAILGGTGDIGKGLALRWAKDTSHSIRIGSRTDEKALQAVSSYRETLSSRGIAVNLTGSTNTAAVVGADIAILAVPPYHVRDLMASLGDDLEDGSIVVSPAVGMTRDETGFHYDQPPNGSVTELVAETAPDQVTVVGAYHNLSAHRLADLDDDLGLDTLVLSDDAPATDRIMAVTEEIDGIRAIDAGSLGNAAEVEAITPLLINVARENDGLEHLGIQFV